MPTIEFTTRTATITPNGFNTVTVTAEIDEEEFETLARRHSQAVANAERYYSALEANGLVKPCGALVGEECNEWCNKQQCK